MGGDNTGATGYILHFFQSFGAATASNQFYVAVSARNAVGTSACFRSQSVSKCIGSVSPTAATLVAEASFTSMDSDGFTINWSTADGTQRVVSFIALGGTDISNVFVGDALLPGSTGNFSVTGVGFKPSLLLMTTIGDATAPPHLIQGTARGSLGMAMVGSQMLTACGANNAVAAGTATGASYQRTTEAFAFVGGTGVAFESTLNSFDSDGFTLNISAATAAYMFFVAINGPLSATMGSFSQPSSTGNQSVTGVGFAPSLVLFASDDFTASTTIQTVAARFSLGATEGVNAFSRWCGYNNGGASTVGGSYFDAAAVSGDGEVLRLSTETGTTNATAKLVSLDTDGFTINWGQADATARQIIFLALASGDTVTEQLQYQLS